MRLRHIEVFHAVYISGSITGAAKLLNVSQPSVSKVLSHAEVYDDKKLRLVGEYIGIRDALGAKFDYDELMDTPGTAAPGI